MRTTLPIAALLASCAPAVAQDSAMSKIAERDLREMRAMLPGTYTNEEQVYFHGELDRPADTALPRLDLIIEPRDAGGFTARTVNPATGRKTEARLSYSVRDGAIVSREQRDGQPDCVRRFTRTLGQYRGEPVPDAASESCGGFVSASPEGFVFGSPDNPFVMKRAREFRCWVSPRKNDDSYGFTNNITIHDQGGRAWVTSETGEHDRVGIKMRRVDWPTGRNRDSLVLYAYRGQDEDNAVSYGWTGPDGDRLALNLRWMQASCTLADNE